MEGPDRDGEAVWDYDYQQNWMPTRTQQLGLIIVLAALVIYVFIRVL